VSASGIARITSARLGLDHYIEDVGIVNNEMETPHDASYAVGWYRTYDRPGPAGNVILSAHETWNHMQGPFYGLHVAQPGDELELRMATGAVYRYRVTTNTRYAVATMPMAEILWPTARSANDEWLTLITCGGRIEYDSSGFGEYLDRDVVVAVRFE
jgi:sortase (surface protein transpeptidase)